jgi:branched-subunit amino acid ABC-type transport system permease component
MTDYLPFIVIGLATGSVYALAAMGLTVTYTTSGIFNFAHGALGMIATFLFYTLRVDVGLPAPVAILIVLVGFCPLIGFFIDRVLLPRLQGAVTTTYVVTSLGLLVALQGFAILVYGGETRQVDAFLPRSTFRLPGVNVGWDQLIIVVMTAGIGVGMWLFFRVTHLGLQTRAVVDDPELTELVGTDARRVTTFSWILGSMFASLSGILLAPLIGLDAAILTLLVVQAFGAAAIGRLTSLPLTYLGGLLVGLIASLSTKFVATIPELAGMPSSVPFIVLFLVLLLSPKKSFQEVTEVREIVRAERGVQLRGRLNVPLIIGGALVALPWLLSGSRLLTATATLVFLLMFRSLGLLVGLSRQVSLSHAVFVGFGATTLAHLLSAGVPFALALLLAALVVVPVGVLIAIPAIRLSGLFLALATFGFGLLVQSLVFTTGLAFGDDGVVFVGRPSLFGINFDGDTAYYFFVLIVVALGVLAVEVVSRTRMGRVLRALADSPIAVESIGISPVVSRVIVFGLSAFIAAISGGLLASLYRSVNTVSFDFFQSLIWLTVLVTAGTAGLAGAALAAVLFVAMPAVLNYEWLNEILPIFFGLGAILMAQQSNGLAGVGGRFFRALAPQTRGGLDIRELAGRSAWRRENSPVAERYRLALQRANGGGTDDI